jgi:hypothetical protein
MSIPHSGIWMDTHRGGPTLQVVQMKGISSQDFPCIWARFQRHQIDPRAIQRIGACPWLFVVVYYNQTATSELPPYNRLFAVLRDQAVTEDSHNALWNYRLDEGSDDGGDDGWRDGFEDGFEDGSALGEDLFCFVGFEGIDEGSDDGCDDGIEDGSSLVFELGFVEGSDHGWRYSIKTASITLWWVERITKVN